jgi:hypothetical protein
VPVWPGNFFQKMDQPLSTVELESLRRNLMTLGDKADSVGKHRIVALANFYWKRVNDQLEASRPLWREAA